MILFRFEKGDRLQRDSERHKPISSVTPADGLMAVSNAAC